MKTNHALSIVAGILLASAVSSAQAGEYQFRHYISGLKPAPASVPEEPSEPEISWELGAADLPKAVTEKAYSYSFADLLTPTGLSGLEWASAGLPTWASLDQQTGLLSGTPSNADIGNASFGVYVAQGDKSAQQAFTIEVAGQYLSVTQIATGQYHTCAVTTDGAAKCWGFNNHGQLGNETTVNSQNPVQVKGLETGVKSIAVQTYHTCAVTVSGAAKCWGSNEEGQLGNRLTADSSIPVQVTGLSSGVTNIGIGYNFTCAINSSGAVLCWGRNGNGQLGNGSRQNSLSPVFPTGLASGVRSLSVGSAHACAVTQSGSAKCWGAGAAGRLGNGYTNDQTSPVQVSGLTSGVSSIAVGAANACAITTAGAVKCWGNNTYGAVGDGTTTDRTSPVSVYGLSSGVKSIDVGSHIGCAITTAGAAKCWGWNYYGQIGDGTKTSAFKPITVTGFASGADSISADRTSCLVTTSGLPKCWGYNGFSSIGDGTNTNRLTPVDVLAN